MDNSYYNSRFKSHDQREAVWEVICEYLQKEIPGESKLLDLGAGYCSFINNISAAERHALDVFEDFSRYAKKDVVTHVQSSVDMGEFDTEYFDIVFASNFFEHLGKDEFAKTIFGVKRILKTGGKLIVIQPNFKYCYREYFDDYTHMQVFTHVSFADILTSYDFSVKKLIPRFIPFSMKSRIPKNKFLIKIYLNMPFKPFASQMLVIAENLK